MLVCTEAAHRELLTASYSSVRCASCRLHFPRLPQLALGLFATSYLLAKALLVLDSRFACR